MKETFCKKNVQTKQDSGIYYNAKCPNLLITIVLPFDEPIFVENNSTVMYYEWSMHWVNV